MVLFRCLTDLLVDTEAYELHLQQYEKCRERSHDVMRNLKVGELFMFRDFVNQYTLHVGTQGKKDNQMKNLVLVCYWREEENGPLFHHGTPFIISAMTPAPVQLTLTTSPTSLIIMPGSKKTVLIQELLQNSRRFTCVETMEAILQES